MIEQRYKITRAPTRITGKGLVEAVLSTEAKDRDGDIIRASGWDLENFRKHPVLLSSHNYGTLKSVIGHWESVEVKNKQLVGVAEYYTGKGNDEADWGFQLAEMGRAAYSVGFSPDMSKAEQLDGDGWMPSFEFKGQELLEASHVTIPANPEALQRAKGLKMHPVIDEIIADALGSKTLKSKHGEHDHDKEGQHDHDEDKALLLAQVRDLITLELSPAIYKEVAEIVSQELKKFLKDATGAPAKDYLTIALQAKEQVLRGY